MDFYEYFDIPIFIVEKIFTSFSKTYRDYLCEEEFVDNLYKLYMGSFEETVKIIFDILDYDQDGILIKDEIKIFLSYLPLEEVDEDGLEEIKENDLEEINENSLEEISEDVLEELEEQDEKDELYEKEKLNNTENKEINEKPVPVHSILKTVKEIPNETESVDTEMRINNDLERANSKRSRHSIEKKNVIFNEENNDYIDDISCNITPYNSNTDITNNRYYETNKIHNELCQKKFVSDTDINKAHLNEINKFNNLENEVIDSNKTLIEGNEENSLSNNGKFLKLDFETSDRGILNDMKDILTSSWEEAAK